MTRVRAKANGIRIAAWALAAVVGTACPDSFAAGAEPGSSEAKVLDDFESLKPWTTFASDQVSASLRQVDGPSGKAMCLAYDFHGVSGYAVARRKLPMDYPGNFEFSLKLRGEAPANQLEFKLPDASGDNVWWATRRDYVPPQDWTPLRIKRRHVSFAWGPSEDRTLRRTESFEITIAAGKGGGKGELCFDELRFRALPPADAPPPPIRASADHGVATHAIDGDAATAWEPTRGAITLDLGRQREFGGVTLDWAAGREPKSFVLEASDDGQAWRSLRHATGGYGGADAIALPEAEARYLRLTVEPVPGQSVALREFVLEPLSFSATPNDFIKALAARAPRGTYPRGFHDEQPYWTIVGVDGGLEPGLLGEDGAVESAKGGFSVEPFLLVDGARIGWGDVRSTQSLAGDYLPIPSVDWSHAKAGLRVTAFAMGDPKSAAMVVRYRVSNPLPRAQAVTLALALRPFQVNPPTQFLNTVGGVSPIHSLAMTPSSATVNGERRVFSLQAAASAFALPFDSGLATDHLFDAVDNPSVADDPAGLASGAFLYPLQLAPGASQEVVLWLPLAGGPAQPPAGFDVERAQDAVAAAWRESLDRVQLEVPAAGQEIVDTLRTALAHMLISRKGPRLQPGTRSYARAWIRDGAMINEGLLRLGHGAVAEEFLRWYAPFQFANGKVPCCVDDRGSDPVPENDSQGELIYAIAEQYRYEGKRELLEAMWPRVQGAVRYMDELRRSERTEANRTQHPELYGLMPASISHEGYSAKPMHSYWDDFWALRGYKDAVDIATWLGHAEEAKAFAASRDEFAADLYASLDAAAKKHGIDFLPGAAELGDFDATSTTIALAPGGEQHRLPAERLEATFERYWREFVQRRDGKREWKDYTPYELRVIGTFVRLGWRDRAHEALDFLMKDRQPEGWNQWAEVVARDPRRPFCLGDLPHAWVASDYVRSALDLFAYERDADHALVLAAGIPEAWLDGKGIRVRGLRTPYGPLSYSLRREGEGYRLTVDAGVSPPGGFVLRDMEVGELELPFDNRLTPMVAPAR